jgi:hypothetical protein
MTKTTPSEREVVVLRNVAGSAWLEAGRTKICPTPEWIRTQYGEGRYEVRLMRGREILCVVRVGTSTEATSRTAPAPFARN